jgi:2-polyprenyl-3-methyl-5-hydroxy-6-metoxy-1,4-benzoquinol methylase
MPDNSHVADVGEYFGNFSIMFAEAGYRVTAIDSYSQYGQCFSPILKLFHSRGVGMMERLDVSLSPEKQHFDAVLLMGVIEHIPHTPRALLEAIFESLKPGGVLILDTPNLGYVYNRQRLARGESIFPAIQSQFWTEVPFEGHHREYTRKEIEWMLETVGLEIQSVDAFNYSLYSIPHLSGIDLENFKLMESDESMRELLMVVARRPD